MWRTLIFWLVFCAGGSLLPTLLLAQEPNEEELPEAEGALSVDELLPLPEGGLSGLLGDNDLLPQLGEGGLVPTTEELVSPDFGAVDWYREPNEPKLLPLARRIAPAVVAIRAWDEFGEETASACGFFLSEDGLILTDVSLVLPEVVARTEYLTVSTAEGRSLTCKGILYRDLQSGVAVLKADVGQEQVQFLQLSSEPVPAGLESSPVNLLALDDRRGILLVDASMRRDPSVAGAGWLLVEGADSPGAVGSPILNSQGEVIGLVALRLPLKRWLNYAAPMTDALVATQDRSEWKQLAVGEEWSMREITEDRRFLKAFEAVQNRRFRSAARILLQLTKEYPRSPECWALLGIVSHQLGATVDATACARRAAALDPEEGQYWYQLAVSELRGGGEKLSRPANPRAVQSLEQTVLERPADIFSWVLLAQEYVRGEQWPEAAQTLEQVTKLQPGYAQGFYLLGVSYGKLGRVAEAEAAIARCLQLDSKHASGNLYQGLILAEQGDWRQARDRFREVTRIDPQKVQAWLQLAKAEKQLKRENQAKQAFNRYLELTGE
ncbi:MAG: tetratricopeptide repeat protein [Verrucomicrobiota bacterium]